MGRHHHRGSVTNVPATVQHSAAVNSSLSCGSVPGWVNAGPGNARRAVKEMQKPPKHPEIEGDEITAEQEAENSYNSHSDLPRYQNGMYNKGFSSSRENYFENKPESIMNGSKTTVDVEIVAKDEENVPVSDLPLVDSLLAYKSDVYGCKTPLVPPRKSREHSKEKIVKENRCSTDVETKKCDEENKQTDMSDIIFYPEHVEEIVLARKSPIERRSRGVQAWPTLPYRLRVLPYFGGGKKFKCSLSLVGRLVFSQIGLGSILFLWALAGATAFRYTEGPREERATEELVQKQKDLVTSLITQLREDTLPKNEWDQIIEKHMASHEKILAEGGTGMGQVTSGHVWTLPGCVLFAVSLITTLGFGAPVPKTPEGRGVAIAFAAVGIPLHLLLVLNIGMAIAAKLHSIANRKPKTDNESQGESGNEISKTESKIDESYHRSNGIFSASRHKRTGSEPIGRQALNNIANQTGFRLDQSKEIKYFYITETDPKQTMNNESGDSNEKTKWSETNDKAEDCNDMQYVTPKLLKWFPFIGIFIYFVMGVLLFGVARCHSFSDSLMFPLEFTVAGGVALTPGYVRVLYALYLEGAVVWTAITVSVLQVSATQGLTNIGLKYNLLTNSR